FPVKTFVLSLPSERNLTIGDVTVTENGGAVAEAKLLSASKATDQTFGVVLLIDTSQSMHGKPLAAAYAAARAFAARRNSNEQLGVITFNRAATPVQQLTTSEGDIKSALATPAKPATVTHTALAAHLRIYTIGLTDKSYSANTLKALAAAGHGHYAQAAAGNLASLFDRLSRLISNE